MSRLPKEDAIKHLEGAGAKVSDYEYTLYADGECSHCGSALNYGHVDVEKGSVDSVELQTLVEEVQRRSGATE